MSDAIGRDVLRRHLPTERASITHKFTVAGHKGYFTVGLYEDGTPGELFIRMAKEGSTLSGLLDTVGVMTSLALQYGVPLSAICRKLRHMQFEPSGQTENAEIKRAGSITDYIFTWLEKRFVKSGGGQGVGREVAIDNGAMAE